MGRFVLLGVTAAALLACTDGDQDPDEEVVPREAMECSSVGLVDQAFVDRASVGDLFKIEGEVAADARPCAAGEPCETVPMLVGTGLRLANPYVAPAFCSISEDGDARCWPYSLGVPYWMWGEVRDGFLVALGFCRPTTATGLVGVYEGRMLVNDATGWNAPVLRLSIYSDTSGTHYVVEDIGQCTNCQGRVARQEASAVLGDGLLSLRFVVDYWEQHDVMLELASINDALYGSGTTPYTEWQDLKVQVSLEAVEVPTR